MATTDPVVSSDGTTSASSRSVDPDTVLDPLPEGWLQRRPSRYWAWQMLALVPATTIDWLLSVLAPGDLALRPGWTTWLIGAVILVLYSTLLVRRRWPVLAFFAVWTPTMVLSAFAVQPFVGVCVALHGVAALTPRRTAGPLLALSVIPGVTQALLISRELSSGFVGFIVPALFFTLLNVAIWLVGRHEFRGRLSAQALRHQLQEGHTQAAERERARIARELHDILSHSVSAMMMQAAGARALTRALGPDHPDAARLARVESALTTIEETGSQSLRELHRLLGVLREKPIGSEPRRESDGDPEHSHLDLDDLVRTAQDSGLTVQVHRSGPPRPLDPSVATAAYRVVQESLTNALKHGGTSGVAEIYETWQPDHLQLQVRNRHGHDAGTSPAPGSGAGLTGLRERVELSGGIFTSGWIRDEFVTTASIPLSVQLPDGEAP